MSSVEKKIEEAKTILSAIGMPKKQISQVSALCVLALLDLRVEQEWSDSGRSLLGITPIMDYAKKYYSIEYAPNSRETFRRQSMHQFVSAGVVLINPDDPKRPINSGNTAYRVSDAFHELAQSFGTKLWTGKLENYLENSDKLADLYEWERSQNLIPVKLKDGTTLNLSSGKHSQLIKEIIDSFAPRFVPGSDLIYVGDTASKSDYFQVEMLAELGVTVDNHGKMPDVIFYYKEKNWLILVESVTSHGPVDGKRHIELSELFSESKVGIVYVTAFPSRSDMSKYLTDIAWETEVWFSDAPSHLIHFNGDRFLGPHNE